jgi:hypothetical protein
MSDNIIEFPRDGGGNHSEQNECDDFSLKRCAKMSSKIDGMIAHLSDSDRLAVLTASLADIAFEVETRLKVPREHVLT